VLWAVTAVICGIHCDAGATGWQDILFHADFTHGMATDVLYLQTFFRDFKMSGHESWECQGRQEHGWFGSGTCDTDKVSPSEYQRLRAPAPGDAIQWMAAVAFGAAGHLPAQFRNRYSEWLTNQGQARLDKAMQNWTAKSDERAGEGGDSVEIATALRSAVKGAHVARTQGELRDAAEHLAGGYRIAQSQGAVSQLGAILGALFGINSAAAQSTRNRSPAQYPSVEQLTAIIYNETSSLYQIPGGPDLHSVRLAIAHVVLNRFDIGEKEKVALNSLKPQEYNAIFRNRLPDAVAAYESARTAATTVLGRWVSPDGGPESGLYYNNRPTGSTDPNTSTGRPRPFLGTFGPYGNIAPSPHAPAMNSYFAFFGKER